MVIFLFNCGLDNFINQETGNFDPQLLQFKMYKMLFLPLKCNMRMSRQNMSPYVIFGLNCSVKIEENKSLQSTVPLFLQDVHCSNIIT